MNSKYDNKIEKITNEFANQIRGKEDAIKQQFIANNDSIKTLSKQIEDTNLLGAISCQQRIETKDMVAQHAANIARRSLGKLAGVNVKDNEDNEEFYYLTLTTNTLSYLHYNEDGDCMEYLSFDRNKIINIESGEITASDSFKNKAFSESRRLSFKYEDKLYKFFFYQNLYPIPTDKNNKAEDEAKLNYLFGKPFLEFAQGVKNS